MTVGGRRHDAGTALGTAVPGAGPAPEIRVCEALAPVVPFDRAAVALASGPDCRSYLRGSDRSLTRFGDLQQTLGEGPELDVLVTDDVVLVDDLRSDRRRWPALSRRAPQAVGLSRLLMVPLGGDRGTPPLGLLAVARSGATFGLRDIELVTALGRLVTLSLVTRWARSAAAGEELLDLDPDDVSLAVGVLMARSDVVAATATEILRAGALDRGTTLREEALRVLGDGPYLGRRGARA